MIKGFRQLVSLTVISRMLGMVRDMAFAYFLGAGGVMDSWVIAFKIPNLARRIFGEGAAASSFIPVYSKELERDQKAAARLANTVVCAVFVILSIVVILGEGFVWGWRFFYSDLENTNLMLELTGIMLPYMILICTVAILAGILNTHRHFAAPAAAPIILNVCEIVALLAGGWLLGMDSRTLVFFTAWGVMISGVVQIFIHLGPLRRHGVKLKPAWDIHSDAFKKIMILMGPMIFGLTVTQFNTLADDWIARWFSGGPEKGEFFSFFGHIIRYPLWEGAVSHLYYSQRLYQFPLGVFGISLGTAIFPVMSSDAARLDWQGLTKTIAKGIRGSIFIAIPATAGMILVARPLVAVIFQRGEFTSEATSLTSYALIFYSIGLCGYFMQQILTRAFYAVQDSSVPAKTAALSVIVNVILNLTLIWFMGIAGLALSTALCSFLQVSQLIRVLKKRYGNDMLTGVLKTTLKTSVSTASMTIAGLVVLYFLRSLPMTTRNDLLRIALVVPVCAGVYTMASILLKADMLRLITGKMKK